MRVLQLNKYLYPRGGAETYMFQLSEALKCRNVAIEYWGMINSKNIVADTYECFAENIEFAELGIIGKFQQSINTIYSGGNRKKIAVILDKYKPDIVHMHNYNFQLTPSILQEIKKRKIKIVNTVHDSQMLCPYHRLYNYQRGEVCLKCVEGNFLNCIYDRCFEGSFLKSLIGTAESVFYNGLNYYNRYVDVFISPSIFLYKFLAKKITRKMYVLPNFVAKKSDIKAHHAGNEYILYFGRISAEKGILDVQNVFSSQKIPLIIIGDGPDKNKICESEYVKYVGPKYGQDLLSYVAGAKYVIQPSIWYENCPMSIIESFMCGTPVLVPKHSGFIDMVSDGVNGHFVDFDNHVAASGQLLSFFNGNTERMRVNCTNTYNEKYCEGIHVDRILEIYKETLNAHI